jgi:hypothetical protein
MRTTKFTSGDWNAICDVCGFKFKASQLVERWDGLMVCSKDWETRHPQELIRPIPDQQKLPWTRPEGTDTTVLSCTVIGRQGVADLGVADCAICNLDLGFRDEHTITSA